MKFINEDGEIVEGELVSPLEEQALESFRKKLDTLPVYLSNSNKQYILRMLVKDFVIQPRNQAVREPEYLPVEHMPEETPSAETEYGDFPSPSDTEAA